MAQPALQYKTHKRHILAVVFLLFLTGSAVSQSSGTAYNITENEPSQEILNSAVFYEKTSENEFGDEANKYSVTGTYGGLANAMQEANITYNQLRADITSEILKEYQPETLIFTDPNNLNTDEIALIYNWVVRDGGSIYVCSEKAGGSINREDMDTLARLFNMQITPYTLEDDENYISEPTAPPDTSNNTFDSRPQSGLSNFTVDTESIYLEDESQELTENVEKVSFYGASGIKTSENNQVAIEGNPTTYSRNRATFLPGSNPPLYVISNVGRGKAVFSADCDMFTNRNIRKHDNGRLAKNTFEWLMSDKKTEDTGGEKIYYEVSTLSRAISDLQDEKQNTNSYIRQLHSTQKSLNQRLSRTSGDSDSNIFIILLNLIFIGSISGIIYEFKDDIEIPESLQEALVKNTGSTGKVGFEKKTQGLEEELGLDHKAQQLEDELDL